MDRSRFTSRAAGRLIPISLPTRKDAAFIPAEMPPTWEFDPSLWPLLVEAREAMGELTGHFAGFGTSG